MKLTELSALMREFASLGLTMLEIDGERVRMERAVPSSSPAAAPAPQSPPAYSPDLEQTSPKSRAVPVRAPLVGIYYQSAAPGEAPLVRVGDRVSKGQVLCIVEAMKTMNELSCPSDGTITAVLAKDGDVVSFDQLLFEVTP